MCVTCVAFSQVLERAGLTVHDDAPWTEGKETIGESLLTPTRIYVNEVLHVHEEVRHGLPTCGSAALQCMCPLYVTTKRRSNELQLLGCQYRRLPCDETAQRFACVCYLASVCSDRAYAGCAGACKTFVLRLAAWWPAHTV